MKNRYFSMIKKRVFLLLLVLVVLATLLACGLGAGAPTPAPDPPTSAPDLPSPSPAPPTATPIPLTATPIPGIAQPDATFAGSMTNSRVGNGASAERGEIEFMTSVDGTAIVSLSVTLFEMNCSYEYDYTFAGVRQSGSGTETATSGVLSHNGTFPILDDGSFKFEILGLQVNGQFTSISEANGVISISQEIRPADIPPPGTNITCDYGSWEWNANIQ